MDDMATETTPLLNSESKFERVENVESQPSIPKKRSKLKSTFIQLLLCFAANLACLGPGMGLGFSAVALPQMKQNGPDGLPAISNTHATWIASIMSIATPIGCLLSGPILDRRGRRMALALVNLPCLAGWLLIAFSPVFWASNPMPLSLIYAGRILTGVSIGMASTPATVYIAEVAEDRLRPALINGTSISISLGVLIVYIFGWLIRDDWRLVAGLSCIFPILSLISIWFLPESPIWLAGKGRHAEAVTSMMKIHRTEIVKNNSPAQVQRESIKSAFCRRETLVPLGIMLGFFLFQQMSGTFVVIFYAVDVVQKAGITIDSYLATVLIGLTRFVFTIVMSFVSKRYGRRPQALISGGGMTLCMGSLALYLYLGTKTHQWIPTTALILYILTSTIGFLTLPWAMIGEVYPIRVRGLASGLTTCIAYVFCFAALNLYPLMQTTLGDYGVFFIYGIASLFGTIYVAIFLPETHGKSLEEIEKLFKKKDDLSDAEDKLIQKKLPITIVSSKNSNN